MIITKLADVITNPKNVPKFHKISALLYIVSILLVICLPYFSEKDNINEKMLRNSDSFGSNISPSNFEKNAIEFLQNLNKLINEEKYMSKNLIVQKLFQNVNINKDIFEVDGEKVFSFHIPSIINDRNKYILMTFIYDSDSSAVVSKNMYLIYNFLKYFEDKNNYRWKAKDLKIILISKELYYNKPKSLLNVIQNSHYFTETNLDFSLNLEIDDDVHDAENIILGITGKNSENIDSDLFKLVTDNLGVNFLESLKTYEDYFSDETKSTLMDVFKTMDESFVNALASQFTSKNIAYEKYFVYFLENMIDTYFRPKMLDFNHLLISENVNSMSIRTSGAAASRLELLEDRHFFYNYKKKIEKNYQFFQALEKILKGMNIVEIQIFRGSYNYFPTSATTYIPFDFVFLIPLFAGIHIAYKVLENLQKLDFSSVNKAKISVLTALMFFFYLFLFLEIENYSNLIKNLFDTTVEEYYIFILILILSYIINVVVFRHLVKMNKNDFKLFETHKMYLVTIMSYSIFMVNYGIGLMACLMFYSFEAIYSKLSQKYTKSKKVGFLLLKLIPDAVFVYLAIAEYDEYFYIITHNYINYFNNTYFLFCLFYVLSVFNITCTAIQIQEKFAPIENKLKLKVD